MIRTHTNGYTIVRLSDDFETENELNREMKWIESYHLSRKSVWVAEKNKRREQIKVHNLSNLEGLANFEKHAAYLAKTETKKTAVISGFGGGSQQHPL